MWQELWSASVSRIPPKVLRDPGFTPTVGVFSSAMRAAAASPGLVAVLEDQPVGCIRQQARK